MSDNIFEYIDKILVSARRNPEQNVKPSLIEFLNKYPDDPNMYVTFKSLEKIGVNPRAKWGHMSPVGVYAYPLSFVKRTIEWLQDDPSHVMPFAFNKKYVYVIKQVDVPGLKFIEDGSMYDDADLERDVKKLGEYLKDKYEDNTDLSESLADAKRLSDSYFNCLYIFTKELSRYIITRYYADTPDNDRDIVNLATVWNTLFRKVLGYSGVADPRNKHVAHGDIDYETIFFTTKAIKVVDAFNNELSKHTEISTGVEFKHLIKAFVKKAMKEKKDSFIVTTNNDYYNDNNQEIDSHKTTTYKVELVENSDYIRGSHINCAVYELIEGEYEFKFVLGSIFDIIYDVYFNRSSISFPGQVDRFMNKLYMITTTSKKKFTNESYNGLYNEFITMLPYMFTKLIVNYNRPNK